jgi:hypothetical protein
VLRVIQHACLQRRRTSGILLLDASRLTTIVMTLMKFNQVFQHQYGTQTTIPSILEKVHKSIFIALAGFLNLSLLLVALSTLTGGEDGKNPAIVRGVDPSQVLFCFLVRFHSIIHIPCFAMINCEIVSGAVG